MARIIYDTGTGIPGFGPLNPDIAVVTAAPTATRRAGQALEPVGPATLAIINRLSKDGSIYVTNLIKEPTSAPTKGEVHSWTPSLIEELSIVNPKRILALGDLPARALCPKYSSMREDHGTFFKNDELGVWVVPTHHFSQGAKNASIRSFTARDVERFLHLPDPTPQPYVVIHPELKGLAAKIPHHGTVVLDVETAGRTPGGSGLDLDAVITSLGLHWEGEVPHLLLEPNPENVAKLGRILKAKEVELVGHNMPFDLRILMAFTDWKWPHLTLGDTMVLAHLGGNDVLSLKHLTTFYTDRPGSRSGGSIEDPLYLAEDVFSTTELNRLFEKPRNTFIYSVLRDLIPVVSAIQLRGVYLDGDIMADVEKWAKKEVAKELKILNGIAGRDDINWNSSQQVAQVLQDAKVPLVLRTDAGALSVKEMVLLPLREKYKIVDALLKYREAEKTLTGFCYSYDALMDDNGFLHPRVKLTGTATGRLSMAEPNLQQVTRVGPLKTAFIPRWEGGKYGIVDLDQAELRIAALLSQDQGLISALLGEDVHREIASRCFKKPQEEITSGERKASKKVTFGLLYGGSARGIGEKAGLTTAETQAILDSFLHDFKLLARWMEKSKRQAVATGEIETIFGRIRNVRDFLSMGQERRVHRLAVNTPIQSAASDCMLVITRGLARRIREHRLKSRILFGVHDSLLTEVYPGEQEIIARAVQSSFEDLWESPLADIKGFASLPLTGSFIVGDSWAACESTNEAYAPEGSWLCSSQRSDFAQALITREEQELWADWEEEDDR